MFPTDGLTHPEADIAQDSFSIRQLSGEYPHIPLIVSCPHAGISLGTAKNKDFSIPISDILARGDRYTDWLSAEATSYGATQLICHIAPTYLNVGRSDKSINPSDVLGGLQKLKHDPDDIYIADGQGLVATRSLYEGESIYTKSAVPDETEIEFRLNNYYYPYHNALEGIVSDNINLYGYAFVFDVHSCPSIGTKSDKDVGQKRTDLIFGITDAKSCDSKLVDQLSELAKTHNLTSSINAPYSGGFITKHYSQSRNKKTESLQIELNRQAIGIDEQTLEIINHEKYSQLDSYMNAAIKVIADYVTTKTHKG